MLSIRGLHVYYGGIHALRGIDLDVPDGQIISLIGANGAGKSTTLKSIMGLVPKSEGTIMWNEKNITNVHTKEVVGQGIVLCPEGRRVFPDLTVEENLRIGAYLRNDKAGIQKDKEWVYDLFPRMKEREWLKVSVKESARARFIVMVEFQMCLDATRVLSKGKT